MPSCVFRRCTNYTNTVKDKDISFFRFPTDGVMKEKWVRVVRKQRREDDWIPSLHSTVCSDHFRDTDIYVTNKNIRRLKRKTAVPIIQNDEPRVTSSPSGLEDVNLSDEESIFDSPAIVFLKAKIERITQDKCILQAKNCNLVRRVKRLKIKCRNLSRTVIKLQKKTCNCEKKDVKE